jgi:hypothetical protein
MTPLALAFIQQRPLVESVNQRDIAVLPRQAGKTTAAALRALHVAEQPHARLVTYITKTRKNAKRIFWRALLEWAAKCGHDVANNANWSELVLRIDHHDGTYCLIELLGAHDLDQIELLRGTQYDLVIVDEAGFIRKSVLESLLTEVIFPGCRVRRGCVLLIGTPGPLKLGPFFEAYASGKWQQYRWTAYDNPATPPGSIEKEVADLGLQPTDPRYIREYLAQWYDGRDDSMVWEYQAGRNDPDVILPTAANDNGFEAWRYSWGIDLASSQDNDALVVLGWDTRDPHRRLYEVDCWQAPGTELIDDLEKVLKEKRLQWKPSAAIGDDDGHGAKKILNTLAPRLGIVFQQKPGDVEGQVRLMNTDFRTERFRLRRGGALADDFAMEQWEVQPSGKRKIGGERHSDLTAAARYAYAAAMAHRAKAMPVANPDQNVAARDRITANIKRDLARKQRRFAAYR